jgi:Ni/Fe-hydrogenase subunit HybB-like protein
MSRARRLKLILWAVVGLAAAVGTTRMLVGLGTTTHLSDAMPWGLWIGFDVMAGVALASGGFIMTASVYIFKLERFHDVVRPAVLTAFLGYLAVVVGLLFDLGLPWNIWHMIVFWNAHSPLFEVGWCVMLYLTVLALEFFPVPAEEFGALAKVRRVLLKWRLPLVITGIGLSTLHQSSLGSLFLGMPYHLHPLWYSPWLPVLFLVSAIALGLQMVIVESHFTAYLYQRKPETHVLEALTTPARWILLVYLVLRFGDLAARGQLARLGAREWQVAMFWFEVAVMAVLPIALLSIARVRRSRAGQWTAAGLGVFGVVLNRVDVGGLVHGGRGEALYIPAWTEITVSAGVVAAAVLAFLFCVERFAIWRERPADPEADPLKLPEFDQIGATWLGVPAVAGRTMYSMAFVVTAAIGFALLPTTAATASRGVDPTPARGARGADVLWIDGNLDGNGVAFPHDAHKQREGGEASCARCHHMDLPRDRGSGCFECHRDMWLPSDAFGHERHASPSGGRLACVSCHAPDAPRTGSTAQPCAKCHTDLIPAGASIQVKNYVAVGYVDAMHGLCITCHTRMMASRKKPDLARCTTCHRERRSFVDAADLASGERVGASVVLPRGVAR